MSSRLERVILSIGRAIDRATTLRDTLLQIEKASRQVKAQEVVTEQTQEPQPTDSSQATQGPPPLGFAGRKEYQHFVDSVKDTPLVRQLAEQSRDRGAGFEHDIAAKFNVKDEQIKDIACSCAEAIRHGREIADSWPHVESKQAKRDIEVELPKWEDVVSSVLPKQKGYQWFLEAIESGDAGRVEDAIQELRIAKSRLEVQAQQQEVPPVVANFGASDKGKEGEPPATPADAGGTNDPKPKQVMRWAEDYIKQHLTDAPTRLNELLRLVKKKFGTCGVPTLNLAVAASPVLQTWKKKTAEWTDNKKRANRKPNSLDEALRPDDGGHSRSERDDKANKPEEEADKRVKMDRLCLLSHDELLKKTKDVFYDYVQYQNESGQKYDAKKKWQELMSDPNANVSNKESLAQWCLTLRDQCSEILRSDPKARSDPKKKKYLLDLKT